VFVGFEKRDSMLKYPEVVSNETQFSPPFVLEQALATDREAIEVLLDAAFGPERQKKTAYRFREGNKRCAGLSFVVRTSTTGLLCATIEFWPIVVVAKQDGLQSYPALLLGPIAVDKHYQGQGLGSALMQVGLAAASAQGHQTVLLVGDMAYYGRFGFSNDKTQGWQLPGPVEQQRVLAWGVTHTLPEQACVLAPSMAKPGGEAQAA
jgi:predicted N-acetyltransferase YhbS